MTLCAYTIAAIPAAHVVARAVRRHAALARKTFDWLRRVSRRHPGPVMVLGIIATIFSTFDAPLWMVGTPADMLPAYSVRDAKLIRSMSRKGCSPDNAACEGFFGRLKTELFYCRERQAATIEQFVKVVDSYIRSYSEKRIKISLGSLSPPEYRESLGLVA